MDSLAVRSQDQQRLRTGDQLVPTRTAVLRLRPAPTAEETQQAEQRRGMRVSWDAGVREPQNQQVSKCCCVFHKKKLFGESSSDSSSDDDTSSDEDGGARGAGTGDASGEHGCAHGCTHDDSGHTHAHPPRKHRPRCTKDHCYCGTRFH